MPSKKSRKSSSAVSVQSLLKNKWILYVMLIVSVARSVQLLYINDIQTLTLFIGVAVLTYFFTKNMILILGTGLIVSSICKSTKEGMENNNNNEEKTNIATMDDPSGSQQEPEPEPECAQDDEDCKKKREKFHTRLAPKSLDEEDDLDQSYIDKGKTIENAYASLDKLIGKGGIDKLSDETNKLLENQQKLMQSINTIGPLMKNMNSMVDKFTGGEKKNDDNN